MRNPLSPRHSISLLVLSLILAGCTGAPYDKCFGDGGHGRWRTIAAPPDRDALLDLVVPGTDPVTARTYLDLQATGELDAWFRHADGRLMACAIECVIVTS